MRRQYIKFDFENIKLTLKLADKFYESAFSSIKKIPVKYRFAIIVARRVYRQIGKEIIKKKDIEKYKKSGKIYVNKFGKIIQTVLSLGDLIKLVFTNIENHQTTVKENKVAKQIANICRKVRIRIEICSHPIPKTINNNKNKLS